MFKTWWPFKLYYQSQADRDYYKKRHDELNVILTDRNMAYNKLRLENGKLWKGNKKLYEENSFLKGRINLLMVENKKLSEMASGLFAEVPSGETPDNGIVLSIDEKDLEGK